MRLLLVMASLLMIMAVNINEDCLDFSGDHIHVIVRACASGQVAEKVEGGTRITGHTVPVQIDIVKAGGETRRFFKNTEIMASPVEAKFDLYKDQLIEVIVTPYGWEGEGYYPKQRAFVKTLTWEQAKAATDYGGTYIWDTGVTVEFVDEKPDWIKLWE